MLQHYTIDMPIGNNQFVVKYYLRHIKHIVNYNELVLLLCNKCNILQINCKLSYKR